MEVLTVLHHKVTKGLTCQSDSLVVFGNLPDEMKGQVQLYSAPQAK